MNGDAIGDAKTKFLKDVYFGSGDSVGMSLKMLGASFPGFPVPCGQGDNSNGGGIGHGLIIHLLGFRPRLEKKMIGSSDMVPNRNLWNTGPHRPYGLTTTGINILLVFIRSLSICSPVKEVWLYGSQCPSRASFSFSIECAAAVANLFIDARLIFEQVRWATW